MDRCRAVLEAIRADNSQALPLLEESLDRDRDRVLPGLAVFIAAALAGVVLDPDNL